MASSSTSKPQLQHAEDERAVVDRPATPPATLFGGSSTSGKGKSKRGLAVTEFEEQEDDLDDFQPTDLDLLIAQTRSILLASTECLSGMIEAREQLKRYHALDQIHDRTLEAQESGVRRRMTSCNDLDSIMSDLEHSVDQYTQSSPQIGRRAYSDAGVSHTPLRPSLSRIKDNARSSMYSLPSVIETDDVQSTMDDFATAFEHTPPVTASDSAFRPSEDNPLNRPGPSFADDLPSRLSGSGIGRLSVAKESVSFKSTSSGALSPQIVPLPELCTSPSTCQSEDSVATPHSTPVERRRVVSPTSPLALMSRTMARPTLDASVYSLSSDDAFAGVRPPTQTNPTRNERPVHQRKTSSAFSDQVNLNIKPDLFNAKGSVRKGSSMKGIKEGMSAQERLLSFVTASYGR